MKKGDLVKLKDPRGNDRHISGILLEVTRDWARVQWFCDKGDSWNERKDVEVINV